MLEIRRSMAATGWGKTYLVFFWLRAIAFGVESWMLAGTPHDFVLLYVVGYAAFVASREAVCVWLKPWP